MFLRMFLLWLVCTPLWASAVDDTYPLQQVTDGIYYHQGVHEDANKQNLGAIANVGFIEGDKCIAVIDSGGSYTEGKLLNVAIRKITDKPICYLINTHVHPDHILGNAAFYNQQHQPVIIGHSKLPAAIEARKSFYEKTFSEILGEAYKGAEFISPQQTVAVGSPMEIDLGNRKLTLTAYSTSHTDHDLTVLDNKTKTLWTGDLLFIERTPVIDGSLLGWIKNIHTLMKLDVNNVIPGHGPAQHSNAQQAWLKQLHYLQVIRDQVRDIISELGTIDEATQTVGLEERDKWELFDQYHRRNVTASFVELEWE